MEPPSLPAAQNSIDQRELQSQRELPPTVTEAAYPTRPTRSNPPRADHKTVRFYKGMIHWLGLVMALSNIALAAIAKDTIGSMSAFTAINGFDFVTETYNAIGIVSYNY